MGTIRLAAVAIVVAGVLVLFDGGFSCTREDTAAQLGPVEIKVEQTRQVHVPVWAGLTAIAAGGLVLVGTRRR